MQNAGLNFWHKAKGVMAIAVLLLASSAAVAVTFTTPDAGQQGCAGNISIEKGGVVRCTDASGTTMLPSCAGDLVFDTQGAIRCATAATSPVCTLAASPSSVPPGGRAALTATCNPAATSYLWTGASFASTASGGYVTPTSTTSYSVRGVNATGTGATASATVTVTGTTTPPPSETAPPSCTLTSQAYGSGFYLVSNCNPAASTYAWSANATGCTSSMSSCQVYPAVTTTYTMTGSNSKGTGNTASTTVTKSAVCSLTASPNSLGKGETSTLTVNCNPAAETHVWTQAANLTVSPTGNGATATFTPDTDGTFSFSVVSTSNGVSQTSTASITVSPPVCSVTANPTTIDVGGQSVLTANCTPSAQSYNWTQDAYLTPNNDNTAVARPSVAGVHAYSMSGTNGSGAGALASVSVMVAVPVCTLTASPNPVTTGGTTAVSASCSPAASSYAWSDTSCAASSSTCYMVFQQAGSYPVSVTASNAAGAGATASTSITVNDPGSIPAGCVVAPVTWPTGLAAYGGNGGTPLQTSNGQGSQQAFSLSVSSQQARPASTAYGTCVQEFSISSNACEWDTPELKAKNCSTGGTGPVIVYQTSDQAPVAGACVIDAGKTYYLNVRQYSAESSCRYYLVW